MKKSELKQLIKEAIQAELNEESDWFKNTNKIYMRDKALENEKIGVINSLMRHINQDIDNPNLSTSEMIGKMIQYLQDLKQTDF